MSRPPAARVAAALALGLAAARSGWTQQPPAPERPWRWSVTFSLGLVGRENAAWDAVHLALDSSGWDGRLAGCNTRCPPLGDIIEGRPVAPVLAVRRTLSGRWQARGVISHSSPGSYPGGYQLNPLTVTPSVTLVGVQGVGRLGPFWVGLGPAWYSGEVHTVVENTDTEGHQSGVGLVLSGAFTAPSRGRVFFEAVIERRWLGSVDMPAIPVTSGPSPIHAMSVPLAHVLLTAGVGMRL